MTELRIIFMGTPEFAVPSLEILVEHKYNIVAVITAPDKPQGRGQKLSYSPVKECAIKHNIPVLQPPNLKAPEFLEQLNKLQQQSSNRCRLSHAARSSLVDAIPWNI